MGKPDETAALAIADQAIAEINRKLDVFVARTAKVVAEDGAERAVVALFARLVGSGMPASSVAGLAASAITRLAQAQERGTR